MPVPRCLLVVATIAALGCGKETEEPRGSPILKFVTWQVDGGAPRLVWSRDADAAVAAVVPASGSKIDFVFDGKLDGARIEDTVGGSPVPKANPPITVGWPDMATVMSNPAFAVDVFYNSLPAHGTGTTTAFVQTHAAGVPVRHGGDVRARPERAHQHLRRADGRADRDHRDHRAAGGDAAAQQRHRLDELPRPDRVFDARSRRPPR